MTSKEWDEPSENNWEFDRSCVLRMSYWGENVSNPRSTESAPSSIIRAYADDLAGSGLNVAQLAWRSLASAGEHAGIAYVVHAATQGGVIPFPQMSLARAALLGAARAVYLLEPEDSAERLARAARLANQEVRDARGLESAFTTSQSARVEEATALDTALKELETAAGNALDSVKQNRAGRISELDLLKAVSHHLGEGMEDPDLGVQFVWRMGSGAAHARSWAWGAFDTKFSHPAEQFPLIWSVPLGLMGVAWEIWNRRRGINEPGAFPPVDHRPSINPWLPN